MKVPLVTSLRGVSGALWHLSGSETEAGKAFPREDSYSSLHWKAPATESMKKGGFLTKMRRWAPGPSPRSRTWATACQSSAQSRASGGQIFTHAFSPLLISSDSIKR